jgi:hypothetical protein
MKSAFHLNRVRLTLVLSFVLGALPLHSAVLTRAGLIEVTSSTAGLGAAFVVGDDSDPGYAEFTGALVSFTIAPQTIRAGIWTPTGTYGNGSVYAEDGAAQSWYFDVIPNVGLGPSVNGYVPTMAAMGFGGLPSNGDTGGGQTLGAITGNLLDHVSPSANNVVELAFEQGLDTQVVTFNLTTFHAPEPGRTMLLFGGLAVTLARRRRR